MKQIALHRTGEEDGMFQLPGLFRRADWSVEVTSSSDRLILQGKVLLSFETSINFTSPHGVTPPKNLKLHNSPAVRASTVLKS